MQIKAYDKLNYKTAFFALYNAIKAKGVTVSENLSLLGNIDLNGWSEEDKPMLAALLSVKTVSEEELAKINPTDVVIRGEAAKYVYRLTTVKNADDPGNAGGGTQHGGSNIGLILGIAIPVVVLAAGAAHRGNRRCSSSDRKRFFSL